MAPFLARLELVHQVLGAALDLDEMINSIVTDAIEEIIQDALHGPVNKTPQSRKGKKPNIDRQREEGHKQLMGDYFDDNCVYDATHFRRRFRITRPIFERVKNAIVQVDMEFVQVSAQCAVRSA